MRGLFNNVAFVQTLPFSFKIMISFETAKKCKRLTDFSNFKQMVLTNYIKPNSTISFKKKIETSNEITFNNYL